MSKLSALTAIAAATLLAGCSAVDQPDVRSAAGPESAAPSAAVTAQGATPEPERATPVPAEVTPEPAEATPLPEVVTPMPEEAAPLPEVVTPVPEEPGQMVEETEGAALPSQEWVPDPTDEAPPGSPETPAPTLEPLPAGVNDPFVPPPHGEPNPLAPVIPEVSDVSPSQPSHFESVTVEPVSPGTSAPAATVQQHATLVVVGSGYAPGQEIYVMLGWPNTDYNYVSQPTVFAGPDGSFTFPITIGSDVPPRDYVVMTVPMVSDPEAREALKRYIDVTVTSR